VPFDESRYHLLRRSVSVGVEVVHVEETGSTMDDARAGAQSGRRPGTAYVAAAQTAGRGRLGRSWVSEPGAGLWVTYHLRAGRGAPFLSIAGGLAVLDALKVTADLTCTMKWPNDVLYGHRKIAGILAEVRPAPDGAEVFLGIGINLRTPANMPADVLATATSVEQEGRPPPARETLLAALSDALDRRTRQAEDDAAAMVDEWRQRLSTLGQVVRVTLPDGSVVEGEALDVEPGGSLILDVAGTRRVFAAGDVTSTRPVGT
jgi:BirA family biotin operon repressor/biotin-[acetyl-CoA-carboxylase] ligase